MVFNSWQFLVFFPLTAAGYFLVTMRFARSRAALSNTLSQFFLLGASLFFYACWNPAYLGLIMLSVLVTWSSGLLMEGQSALRKRLVLVSSLIINLGILFFFKYYGFFAESARALSGGFRLPSFNVLLPVGISFYTFQALGYSIDVYCGRVQAERNFLTYALFVTFFPQLVAGPIERTGNLLPQFKVNHGFDYDRVTSGLKLAAWRMFKKVVIADRLALYVNGVYGNPSVYPASTLIARYYRFLSKEYMPDYSFTDFVRYNAVPILSAGSNIVHIVNDIDLEEQNKNRYSSAAEIELPDIADKRYERLFKPESEKGFTTEAGKEGFAYNKAFVSRIIELCLAHNIRPVLISTPITSVLNAIYAERSPDFFDTFYRFTR